MTVVNPKSISGINSITMASGSDNLLTIHSNNTTERVRVDSSGNLTATSFSGDGSSLTGVASTENIRTNTNATFLQNVTVVGTSTVTGNIVPSSDSATDIGTNSVRFQNAYVDTYYGSGANLTGISADVVDDTSPQLGGNLDTNSFEISLDDSHNINFGDGDDFKIRFDGTNSIVEHTPSGSGYLGLQSDTLYLQDNTDGHAYITCVKDGAVGLRYDNVQKLATTNTGVDITGNISFGDGNGLDFSNHADVASGETVSSSLLDDYEEGSWTPQIKGTTGAGTATYNTQTGRYVKIGNFVYLTAELNWTSGSAGGELRVTNLPFSPGTDCEGIGNMMGHVLALNSSVSNICVYVGPGVDYTYFYQTRVNMAWKTIDYDDDGAIIMNVSFRL